MPEDSRVGRPRHARYRVRCVHRIRDDGGNLPFGVLWVTRTRRLVENEDLCWTSTRIEDAMWQLEMITESHPFLHVEIQEQREAFGGWTALTPLTLLARAGRL